MKKIIFLLTLFCLLTTYTFAQFAIINDPDGYTNVRTNAGSEYAIIDQLKENETFNFSDTGIETPTWVWVSYFREIETLSEKQKNNLLNKRNQFGDKVHIEGYVHKSRIIPFTDFQLFKKHEINKKFVVFSHDDIIVQIMTGNFEPDLHTIERHEENWVQKIDGEYFLGTHGGIPNREIKWITIITGSYKYEVPNDIYNELFEPNLGFMKVWPGPQNQIFIEMLNSDGTGGYAAVLVFKDGKFIGKNAGMFY